MQPVAMCKIVALLVVLVKSCAIFQRTVRDIHGQHNIATTSKSLAIPVITATAVEHSMTASTIRFASVTIYNDSHTVTLRRGGCRWDCQPGVGFTSDGTVVE